MHFTSYLTVRQSWRLRLTWQLQWTRCPLLLFASAKTPSPQVPLNIVLGVHARFVTSIVLLFIGTSGLGSEGDIVVTKPIEVCYPSAELIALFDRNPVLDARNKYSAGEINFLMLSKDIPLSLTCALSLDQVTHRLIVSDVVRCSDSKKLNKLLETRDAAMKYQFQYNKTIKNLRDRDNMPCGDA